MRKTEKRNIFYQIFGCPFISKPIRRRADKKEIAQLTNKGVKC